MNPKFNELQQGLSSQFFERDELITGMLVALLAGEHLFMLGVPGTGKSKICEKLCDSINGKYFSWLLTKFTTPEEVFGPISLKAMEQDQYVRKTEGKLPEADIAFLDEIWKASSAILNSLLRQLDETRTFFNGSSATKTPLKTCFAASNEIPDSSGEVSALYDRFALRFVVRKIQSNDNVLSLLRSVRSRAVTLPSLSAKDLEKEQAEVAKVLVGDDILNILIAIRTQIDAQGIFVSDRKFVACVRILQAYAYLQGRAQVEQDDLEILKNVFWSKPEQIKEVARIVNGFCNPLGEKIFAVSDAVAEVFETLKAGKCEALEAFKKIQSQQENLKKLQKEHKSNQKLIKAIEDIQVIIQKIATDYLKIKI